MNALADWDDDIAAMKLAFHEKDGLQVFRNYRRAFDTHAEEDFSRNVDAEEFDMADLKHVLNLVTAEDARFVPVIACAYADDLLKALFEAEIPDAVPGGKAKLLGPYRPFADLFKRLQLAFVFELLSRDLVSNLDRLRQGRFHLERIQTP